MRAKDLIKELQKHPYADIMIERDGELIDVTFVNYIREEDYNDVEYFVLDDKGLKEYDPY